MRVARGVLWNRTRAGSYGPRRKIAMSPPRDAPWCSRGITQTTVSCEWSCWRCGKAESLVRESCSVARWCVGRDGEQDYRRHLEKEVAWAPLVALLMLNMEPLKDGSRVTHGSLAAAPVRRGGTAYLETNPGWSTTIPCYYLALWVRSHRAWWLPCPTISDRIGSLIPPPVANKIEPAGIILVISLPELPFPRRLLL